MKINVMDCEVLDSFRFDPKDIFYVSNVKVNNPRDWFVWWNGPRYEYHEIGVKHVEKISGLNDGVEKIVFNRLRLRIQKDDFKRRLWLKVLKQGF